MVNAPICPRHQTVRTNGVSSISTRHARPQNKLTCLGESQYVGDRYFIGQFDKQDFFFWNFFRDDPSFNYLMYSSYNSRHRRQASTKHQNYKVGQL
jgi:hypothetical protein